MIDRRSTTPAFVLCLLATVPSVGEAQEGEGPLDLALTSARDTFDQGQPWVLNVELHNPGPNSYALGTHDARRHTYWLTRVSSGERWRVALKRAGSGSSTEFAPPGSARVHTLVLDDTHFALEPEGGGAAKIALSALRPGRYTLSMTYRVEVRAAGSRPVVARRGDADRAEPPWRTLEGRLSTGLTLAEPVAAAGRGVRVHDVTFEAVAEPVWPILQPRAERKLRLALEVTNHGSEAVTFCRMDTIWPQLETSAGVSVPVEGGRDGLQLTKPVVVQPGETKTLEEVTARLTAEAGAASIHWLDDTATHFAFPRLTEGSYRFSFRYANARARGGCATSGRCPSEAQPAPLWVGRVVTHPAAVEVSAR